jgi:hypothetical protein
MEKTENSALNFFYYLAPLWFVLEALVWPNFRAGVVFGPGVWGNAAFYSVEAGLGAALWFKLPYANLSALVENIAYLIFALKFILFTPLDIALTLEDGLPQTAQLARTYPAALPGILYSALHVVYKIKKTINRQ